MTLERNARALVRELNSKQALVSPKGYPPIETPDGPKPQQVLNYGLPESVKAPIIQLIEAINGGPPSDSLEALNERLQDLQIIPRLRRASGGRCVADWIPNLRTQGGAFDAWVPYSTLVVWNLAGAGILWKVRRCAQCGRWYLARRKDQQFCRLACRQKNYISSEHGRKKRTAYMRKYRARLFGRRRPNLSIRHGKCPLLSSHRTKWQKNRGRWRCLDCRREF